MRVPAFVQPDLSIGRSFDAKDSTPGIDLFASDVSTITEAANQFSFQYKVISKSEDARDLLDISGELSLKLKVDLVKVSGSGQYLTDSKKKEGTTEVLAVLKCTTEKVVLDSLAKPREGVEKLGADQLGTHYVRSVVYGGEMVASLKLKSSSISSKQQIKGKADGELPTEAVNVGFKAQLDKLASECKSDSDLEIKYYATHLPERLPTTMEELVKTIEKFPKRLKDINSGRGIPLEFEIQPLGNLLLPSLKYKENEAVKGAISEMEERFDDLLLARSMASKYRENAEQENDVVKIFLSQVNKLIKQFRKMIARLSVCGDEDQFDACIQAYTEALDGHDIIGKFVSHWKNNVAKALKPVRTLKLPAGEPLTIALLGKTGNGKSATANQIVGKNVFEESDSASSVTEKCQYERRTEERVIRVIDTPGVLDTSLIKEMHKSSLTSIRKHSQILREVAKIFALAPDGFHAICLVVKYGHRFTAEDCEALEMLQGFLGKKAIDYMIFILTHADVARRRAEKENTTVEEIVPKWISGLPEVVQDFIKQIDNRVVLFDNLLSPEKHPDDHTKQVIKLLQTIDKMIKDKKPYVNELTGVSRDVLDKHIKKAMDDMGLTASLEKLKKEKKILDEQLKEQEEKGNSSEADKIRQLLKELDAELEKAKKKEKEVEEEQVEHQSRSSLLNQSSGLMAIQGVTASLSRVAAVGFTPIGGCYPQSATFVDGFGTRRSMESLSIGEEVQILSKEGSVCYDTVYMAIQHEPGVGREFIRITTTRGKKLNITKDHLVFVKDGERFAAIPARDVMVGNKVQTVDNGLPVEDSVEYINKVFEKGAYAPITMSGTMLVDDVHTSCFFDVLSHSSSQLAMSVVRKLYRLSPATLTWINGIGMADGVPGWCRLVQKVLVTSDAVTKKITF